MIALIVAFANNQVIGNKGRIPWSIEGEQKRFKELTTGNVVIMGRRSYEEIGKPLPNRTTIVISNTKTFDGENCLTAKTLEETIELAGDRDVFIAGGVRLYKEALPMVEKMYITEIDLDVEGDTYFPYFEQELFVKEINEEHGEKILYRYVTYIRK